MFTYIRTYMYITHFIYTCTYVCTYMYVYSSISTLYIVSMHTCMYVCICTCTYLHCRLCIQLVDRSKALPPVDLSKLEGAVSEANRSLHQFCVGENLHVYIYMCDIHTYNYMYHIDIRNMLCEECTCMYVHVVVCLNCVACIYAYVRKCILSEYVSE